MRTFYDCIPCFIKQILGASRKSAPDNEELHGEILKRVMSEMLNLDMQTPPPLVAERFFAIIREMTGVDDPYLPLKDKFNEEAMKLYPDLKKFLNDADDKFTIAVKLAIAGNVIDFGALPADENMDVMKEVKDVINQTPSVDHISYFKEEINKAQNILYIGDNTGEIVFDKLFIEYLMPKNIVFSVRKGPIINDATYRDAEIAGITNLVRVIDNGTRAPGSFLKNCSDEFLEEYKKADLIISKGQGNFETLYDEDANIFFLFRAKCPCVCDYVKCKHNDILVIGKKYEDQFV